MSALPFAALGITLVPSAALVGFASIALFAIVGVVIGPDFNNINIPAKKK
tara:strand:+ start:401 stop:550 length:150 start_codon:yes stop_codon:yes gene_type:complete